MLYSSFKVQSNEKKSRNEQLDQYFTFLIKKDQFNIINVKFERKNRSFLLILRYYLKITIEISGIYNTWILSYY